MIDKIKEYLSKAKFENKVRGYQWKDKLIVIREGEESITRMIHSYQLDEVVEIYESNRDEKSSILVFELGKVVYADIH